MAMTLIYRLAEVDVLLSSERHIISSPSDDTQLMKTCCLQKIMINVEMQYQKSVSELPCCFGEE